MPAVANILLLVTCCLRAQPTRRWIIVAGLLKYRYDLRRAEIDSTLKQEMIQRGMSADEIERVLTAKSAARPGRGAVEKQTLPYPGSDRK